MLSENIERLLKQRYYRDDNETWEGLVNRVVSYVCSEDKELEPTAYQDILERVWLPNSPCLVNAGKRKNSGLMACQPGWVRVHTTNGFYSIKEIVENKINANLDTYWQESAVTNFSQNGTKEVIEVETEKGYRLYVTRDHLVYCIDKKHTSGKRLDGRIRGEWRYGGDLKIGDMLIMPAKESTFSVEYQRVGDHILDESLAEFVAYLQADGHLKKHTSGYTSETLVCEIIVDSPQAEEIFKKFFPRYNVIDHPSGVKRIRGYGNDYKYLLDICDYGTYSATIPEQIYKSPKQVIASYLRGWFDAEGHVSVTKTPKGYDYVKISMSTCSEEIARGVQFLLKALGIISAVYYIRDSRKTRADRWDVVISHKYDNRSFCDLIGFINPEKQNKLKIATKHISSKCRRKKEHFVIKSIISIGDHPVYDISTGNETYLSDGFVVHNCFVAGPGEDDLGIHVDTLKDIAQVAKHGGGCGFTGTFIRAKNKPVAGSTHGYSYGPCAYALRVSDYMDMMTQSGFRRMALMFTLKSDHEDLDEFISMKQTKDERLGYNFNQSIMATDKWMKAAISDPDSKEAKQFDKMVYNAWSNGEPGLLFHDTINRNTPYLEDINCSNPCQPGFATVLTKEGIRFFDDIDVGSEIWSSEGWSKVIQKWSTGTKPVYKYETTAGNFVGTGNHRVVTGGDKIEVSKADSIDILEGNAKLSTIDPQSVMDGLIIGDGSVHMRSGQKVYLTIGEKDYDYFDSEVSHLIVEPHAVKYDSAWKIHTTVQHDELDVTYNREIPERFFKGSHDTVCSFLRGLFSANGYVVGNRVGLKATSFVVIQQVQQMLSSVGIRSYYTTNKSHYIEFSNGTYLSKQSYDLNISTDRDVFYESIGFIQKYKTEKLKQSIEKSGTRKRLKTHDIVNVEYLGDYEVFDITVDNDSHTYWTGGVNVSNCGEQPLPEYGSCNLGSINIAHERFIKHGEFDYSELENVTRTITRFLDNVGTMNVFPNEKFRLWYENNRPIGIGIMGYADALLKLELKYGDRKALGFLHDIMSTIYKTAKDESEKLAILRGLPEKCKQYQRRNITLVSIAPTGSIAFIAECSHGIEPVFSPTYVRTDERGETYTFEHEHGNKSYFMSAINSDPNKVVTWKQHVKTQLVAQKECDSGVSKTINFPSTASVDDVRQAFIYAWKNGAKGLTVYRDKSRETQVLQVTEDEVNNQSCVNGICNL